MFAVSLRSGKTHTSAIGQAAGMQCSQEAFEMQYIRASVEDPLLSDAQFCRIRITHQHSVNQLEMGF